MGWADAVGGKGRLILLYSHMMLYGGIPFARGAMDIAKDVFVNG